MAKISAVNARTQIRATWVTFASVRNEGNVNTQNKCALYMNTLHSSKNMHERPSSSFNVDLENLTELEYVSNVLKALYRLCAQLNVVWNDLN